MRRTSIPRLIHATRRPPCDPRRTHTVPYIPPASKHATVSNCPPIPTDANRTSDLIPAVLSSLATGSDMISIPSTLITVPPATVKAAGLLKFHFRQSLSVIIFTARRHASAVYAVAVCLSVCLSQYFDDTPITVPPATVKAARLLKFH